MSTTTESEQARRVTAFMRGWSLEATLPKPAEIEALKGTLPSGTEVFLSAIPAESHLHLIESSIQVRRAGFEPIPHVSARNHRTKADLEDLLTRVRGEAGVRRMLVIGGDRDAPLGPFNDALAVIQSGLLERHGVEEIGIGGYPDGHPRIGADTLERALAAKLAAAQRAGLKARVVSQFCFDGEHILRWIRKLRAEGFAGQVRVGLAGPAKVTTLLRFAQRCGVRASARGMMQNVGIALQALGRATPDEIVRTLAEATATGELGEVAPHLYSFGGFLATAQWAREAEAASGH
jgi:methylenetetrahydrofolate reductase (NADPH)